jgi:hypothetical protein
VEQSKMKEIFHDGHKLRFRPPLFKFYLLFEAKMKREGTKHIEKKIEGTCCWPWELIQSAIRTSQLGGYFCDC